MSSKALFYCLFIFLNCTMNVVAENFSIKSTSFLNNGNFNRKHSAYGENVSPHLVISNTPKNTQSLVLLIEDPDARAVVGKTFKHLIAQLDPKTKEVEEGKINNKAISLLKNDSGSDQYYGPRPPQGPPHSYYYTLVALNKPFNAKDYTPEYFQDTWNKSSRFYKDNKENIIGFTQIMGKYKHIG